MFKALQLFGCFALTGVICLAASLFIPPFSQQKLGRLQRGMSREQVRAVMGKPVQTNLSSWYYNPRRPVWDVLILDFGSSNQLQNWFTD